MSLLLLLLQNLDNAGGTAADTAVAALNLSITLQAETAHAFTLQSETAHSVTYQAEVAHPVTLDLNPNR